MKKILFLSIFLCSCVIDRIHKIAIIQNKSSKNITVMFQTIDSIDDETLFYGTKFTVQADSAKELFTMVSNFKKMIFFIFNYDTVNNYINQKKIKGIVKNSLLKQLTISKDELKKNDILVYY